MKKILSFVLVLLIVMSNAMFITSAVPTDQMAAPWTRDKAEHLAKSVLFSADPKMVDTLFAAGSVQAAVDILFPSRGGPDRTAFDAYVASYTSSGFNWGDANHTTRLYQLTYALDPYEAKRKLFSLFEDIFAVNNDSGKDVTFKDISELHALLYENMFGNYQMLVKRVLSNNGGRGDYAAGKFLDLFNQNDPKRPNENYARELLQLFLMGEYKPHESKENNDVRNYEESDVLALAKLLTGLRSDPTTHAISFDMKMHYSGSTLPFLTGAIASNPPYYDAASGSIDPVAILAPVNGNNGLADNTIEYIFAKRSDAIALFLADRIVRFYIEDEPSRANLDFVASIIKGNNFDLYPSIKTILALDMMYSESAMNGLRYKNPLELGIGTIRSLRHNAFTGVVVDQNVYDTNLLRRLGWTPYFPGSIFGRDGFDNSLKWSSTSTLGSWMTASNYFTYRTSGTGAIDFLSILGNQKKEITTETLSVMTYANNSFSGSLTIQSGSLTLGDPIVVASAESRVTILSVMTRPISTEEQIISNGYPLDPVVAIEGGENLDFIFSEQTTFIPQYLPSESNNLPEEALPQGGEENTSEVLSTTSFVETGAVKILPQIQEATIPPVESSGVESTGSVENISSGITITGSLEVPAESTILSMVREDVSQEEVIESAPAIGEVVTSEALETVSQANSGEILIGEPPLSLSGSSESLSGGEIGGVVGTGETIISSGDILVSDTSTGEIAFSSGSSESGALGDTSGTGVSTGSGEDTMPSGTGNIEEGTGGVKIQALTQIQAVSTTGSITGSVILPNFRITTNLGIVTVGSGSYDGVKKILTISSGSLLESSGSILPILSGVLEFTEDSRLIADTASADAIIDAYEISLFGVPRFPADTRTLMKDFITRDASGTLIPVAPTNTTYFNKYIRGLLSIMLSQPEYVLQHGYDLPTSVDTGETTFLDPITSKLFFIELYGGNDYMSGIIPKDEYNTYLDYRTNASGSIAIMGTGLVDIGDFYMNSALAYGNSGSTGFKDLYDQGYLKIFNRVGGYRHSSDHDAAAKQISSYDSTTSAFAEGVYGHLVKNELEGSHTISLGAKLPNVYRSGHYVNLGGNVILSNPLDSGGQWKSHMDAMVTITKNRSYPSNTRKLFRDVGRISEIGKLSVTQGGAPGASGDMNSVFSFAKILLSNNIGRAFYMGGAGGYDTHGNQLNGLNQNLRTVSSAVTKFFNEVKDTQDVTIVIFSEFGRTNKANGDLGTDHGDGGGMYVLSSNGALRNKLTAGTYGNMSIQYAKNNALGVGVDYRSVYGSIFQSIYGLDPVTYFGKNISLDRDVSLEKNTMSLLSYSYQASGQNVVMNAEFTISGSNYDPGKAGYTRLLTNTGTSNEKITRLNEKTSPEGYKYSFQVNQSSSPYFRVESFSNQYALTSFSGNLIGSTRPLILAGTTRQISQEKSSILPLFSSVTAPSILSGSGIIIESTGSTTLTLPENPALVLHFGTGITNVTELTSASGSMTWRGGFILGEKIDRDLFIPDTAIITSENKKFPRASVASLIKIGADVRGVGMNLSQPIGMEFRGLTTGENYRVFSSRDGISWDDVEAGKSYTGSMSGSILVTTTHFSYFAVVSTTSIIESAPTCTMLISPSSVLNGSGALLTWTLQNTLTGILSPTNTSIGTGGSIMITPPINATTLYSIQVSNTAGSNACSASVTAGTTTLPPPTLPPRCSITASPTSVPDGSGSTISWTLVNAQTGVLNPGNLLVGIGGSFSVIPPKSATTAYTIQVATALGMSTCTTSITAGSGSTPPVTPPGSSTIGHGGASPRDLSPTIPGGAQSVNIPQKTLPQNKTLSFPLPQDLFALIDTVVGKWENGHERIISPKPITLSHDIWLGIGAYSGDKVEYKKALLDFLRAKKHGKKKNVQASIDTVIAQVSLVKTSESTRVTNISQKQPPKKVLESDTSPKKVSYKKISIQDMGFSLVSGTKYIDVGNTVTIRTTPILSDLNILRYLPRNAKVEILETNGEWSLIRDENGEGYVKSFFLRDEKPSDQIRSGERESELSEQGVINVAHSLYIRERPTIYSHIEGVLFRDEVVTILDRVGSWVEIMTEKYQGFIHGGYIR